MSRSSSARLCGRISGFWLSPNDHAMPAPEPAMKRAREEVMIVRLLLALLGGVALVAASRGPAAQAQNLVIQGGTLIDGTGRAPIENSVIVIEGNRFKAIGRARRGADPGRRPNHRRPRQDRAARLHRRPLPSGNRSGARSICISASRPACDRDPAERPLGAGAEGRHRDGQDPRAADLGRPGRRSARARASSRPKARAPGAAT